MENYNILITGGAGFIGSHLAEYLLTKGYNIRILDNLSTGKIENIESIIEEIEFIDGDICNNKMVLKALQNMDYVFHLAALPSVQRSIEDPLTTFKVNVEGTINLLLASKEVGVKKFIFSSSSSVYGNQGVLPKKEDSPIFPISPYALTKYAAERYCQIFYYIYGLKTVCLRYFNVFGPRQNIESKYAAVIPKFITQVMMGSPITIYGDGLQSRDFTYVDNVVEANYLACMSEAAVGNVINIGCSRNYTINELAKMIMKIIGKNSSISYLPERPGEVKHSLADITKAKERLNYEPKVDLQEGLKRTIDWFSKRF